MNTKVKCEEVVELLEEQGVRCELNPPSNEKGLYSIRIPLDDTDASVSLIDRELLFVIYADTTDDFILASNTPHQLVVTQPTAERMAEQVIYSMQQLQKEE